MGWRYQIPMLLELGFRVVCPNSIEYGQMVSLFSPIFALL
jgi:hypothetical protein